MELGIEARSSERPTNERYRDFSTIESRLILFSNADAGQLVDIEGGWSHDGNESARRVNICMKLTRHQQIRAAIPFKAMFPAPRVYHKGDFPVWFLVADPHAPCGCRNRCLRDLLS